MKRMTTKTGHWVYLTKPSSEKVHLADFDAVHGNLKGRSICGHVDIDACLEGDETVSSFAATCLACLGALRAARR